MDRIFQIMVQKLVDYLCVFVYDKVSYPGPHISGNAVETDPMKVRATQTPETIELRLI